jgi:hypothetical protein
MPQNCGSKYRQLYTLLTATYDFTYLHIISTTVKVKARA